MRTMTRRFYVTNHPIEMEDKMLTYIEAVAKAKERVNSNMTSSTTIVEVVAIVNSKPQPVIIEKIRK